MLRRRKTNLPSEGDSQLKDPLGRVAGTCCHRYRQARPPYVQMGRRRCFAADIVLVALGTLALLEVGWVIAMSIFGGAVCRKSIT